MIKKSTRCGFLASLAALCAWPFAATRAADADSVDAMVLQVTGGANVQSGRIKLELPAFADNGNSVSPKVSVDNPVTAASHVKSIHIDAARNSRLNVANFYLGPRAGLAQISTRVRLGGSQRVLAVAALSDGARLVGDRRPRGDLVRLLRRDLSHDCASAGSGDGETRRSDRNPHREPASDGNRIPAGRRRPRDQEECRQ